MRKLVFAAAAAMLSTAAPASAATFIGDAVTIKRIQGGTNVFKTVTTTVTDAAGFEFSDNFFGIDITANQVKFRAVGGSFSMGDILYEISGLDFDDNPATANMIEGFSASQMFTAPNVLVTQGRASFTPAGAFRMNFNQVNGGASALATITFGAAPAVGGVPEPAAWAMMIGGFGLAGAALRTARRRRRGGLAYSL